MSNQGQTADLLGIFQNLVPPVLLGVGVVSHIGVFGFQVIGPFGGSLALAVGIADSIGMLFQQVHAGGRKVVEGTNQARKRMGRRKALSNLLGMVLLFSGPVYLYLFELDSLGPDFSIQQLFFSLGPAEQLLYLLGGPLFTALIIGARFMVRGLIDDFIRRERI